MHILTMFEISNPPTVYGPKEKKLFALLMGKQKVFLEDLIIQHASVVH